MESQKVRRKSQENINPNKENKATQGSKLNPIMSLATIAFELENSQKPGEQNISKILQPSLQANKPSRQSNGIKKSPSNDELSMTDVITYNSNSISYEMSGNMEDPLTISIEGSSRSTALSSSSTTSNVRTLRRSTSEDGFDSGHESSSSESRGPRSATNSNKKSREREEGLYEDSGRGRSRDPMQEIEDLKRENKRLKQSMQESQMKNLCHQLNFSSSRAPAIWGLVRILKNIPRSQVSQDFLNSLFCSRNIQSLLSHSNSKDEEVVSGIILLLTVCVIRFDCSTLFNHSGLISFLSKSVVHPHLCRGVLQFISQKNYSVKFSTTERLDEEDNLSKIKAPTNVSDKTGHFSVQVDLLNDAELKRFLEKSTEYLENLGSKLSQKSKIEEVARLVCTYMGGDVVTEEASQAYISNILRTKTDGVVPLGLLRLNLSFRPLLFKSLADHVGIPCSFYRNSQQNFETSVTLLEDSKAKIYSVCFIGTSWAVQEQIMRDSVLQSLTLSQWKDQSKEDIVSVTNWELVGDKPSLIKLLPVWNLFLQQVSQSDILNYVSHNQENVLSYYKPFIHTEEKQGSLCLPVEKMAGSLKDKIQEVACKNRYFTIEEISMIIFDVACGMAYLHSEVGECPYRAVHGNLKPSNILWTIKDKPIFKVGYYGLTKKPCNSVYQAPEFKTPSGSVTDLRKADVFSFGLILGELMTLQSPQNNSPYFPSDSIKASNYSDWLKTLFNQCTSPDAKVRPTFKQIMNYITESSVNDLLSQRIQFCI